MAFNQTEEQIQTFKERNHEIWKMRKMGYTLQEVGDQFGLTRERVRQIVTKLERKSEK